MKIVFALLLAGSCSLLWAQTNAPVEPPADQQTDITAAHGRFDGIKYQMVYEGNVLVQDPKVKLTCEKLIVDLQKDGGHPTNILALTNVVVDVLDEKGQTNHVTANRATYTYTVANATTNEMITFDGGEPKPRVENPQLIMEGDVLTFDLGTKQFSGEGFRTIFKQLPNAGGTNGSPFQLFK